MSQEPVYGMPQNNIPVNQSNTGAPVMSVQQVASQEANMSQQNMNVQNNVPVQQAVPTIIRGTDSVSAPVSSNLQDQTPMVPGQVEVASQQQAQQAQQQAGIVESAIPTQGSGAPVQQQAPQAPVQQQNYAAPVQQQAPIQQQNYGAPQGNPYGAPTQQQAPMQQNYGAPQAQVQQQAPQGYGAPMQQQAPVQQQYGAPMQQQNYGAPVQQQAPVPGSSAPGYSNQPYVDTTMIGNTPTKHAIKAKFQKEMIIVSITTQLTAKGNLIARGLINPTPEVHGSPTYNFMCFSASSAKQILMLEDVNYKSRVPFATAKGQRVIVDGHWQENTWNNNTTMQLMIDNFSFVNCPILRTDAETWVQPQPASPMDMVSGMNGSNLQNTGYAGGMPAPQGFPQAPQGNQYGVPAPQQYGAPQVNQQYGAPMQQPQGYGAPMQQPVPQGNPYGAPQGNQQAQQAPMQQPYGTPYNNQ